MIKCEHVELATDDPKRAQDFYTRLFGWTIEAMPGDGGEYLMFRTDNGGGGIAGKMSPQQPTAWMPYFTVPSVKATIAAAEKDGATVTMPWTSIGDMGAIAVVRDPTGASFGLWETAAPPAASAPPAKASAKKPASAGAKATRSKPAPAKATQRKPAPAKAPPAKAKAPAKAAPAKGKKKGR